MNAIGGQNLDNGLSLKVFKDVEEIRKQKPLIHNITNYVVMNNTANALLAIGASPVMAHAVEEVADMVKIASALAVNIGTLSSHWIEGMKIAMSAAKEKGIPIVFDPVGVGATPFRNTTCEELLHLVNPTIIRGNPSEIMALAKLNESNTKGVDSTESSDKALESAYKLSQYYKCVVSISGEVDYIVEGRTVAKVFNGSAMMPLVTGLGCTATSLTAAFAAVNRSYFAAALHAMAVMGIAGEIASEAALGTGTLQVEFIDALHLLEKEQIESRIKIET